MASIDQYGVSGTTLNDYRDLVGQSYLDIDSRWDIYPESPDGQAIAIWSETLANLDEQVQYAYMSRDPATAFGHALDDIAAYAGVERQPATNSTATVSVSGIAGVVIPAGTRIRNASTGTVWAFVDPVEIPSSSGFVEAVDGGAIQANVGSLTQIVDPIPGWQSVTNSVIATVGADVESDTQLRIRRSQSVALPGANQIDNLYASIANVEGVERLMIYENSEDTTDGNGLSGHSIAIFVSGGSDNAVAESIIPKKNPGCGMNRDSGFPNRITYVGETDLGNPLQVTFFRPVSVDIHVSVTINTTEMSVGEQDDIKQAIVDYAEEGYTGSNGFMQRGFNIGESVPSGKLYTPVNQIVGGRGYVESIYVGTSTSPTGQIVEIEFNELSNVLTENIEVTYTV